MAILVQIPNFDILPYTKISLSASISAGGTLLTLTGVSGIKTGDIAILGVLNSITAELVKVKTVTAPYTVELEAGVRYAHAARTERLMLTFFDQIRIYRGTTPDSSTHTLIDTEDILFATNTTTYIDTVGTPANYYSYSYYRLITAAVVGPPAIPAVELVGDRQNLPAFGIPLDVTPQYVRENFLYGLDLTDDTGNPLPDTLYWHGIKAAYHWLEQLLNIDILPRVWNDELDFSQGDNRDWFYMKTRHYPVQSVTSIVGQYYGSEINFPIEWLRLQKRLGIIHMVPTMGTFAQFMYPQGGHILPILNGISYIPGFWKVAYLSGFADNELPFNLRDMIGKRACYMPLNILGDLVGGIAIASKSIGLDGMSQSINTTSSAENAGYSARLRQYEREFKFDIPMLKAYWGRQEISIV